MSWPFQKRIKEGPGGDGIGLADLLHESESNLVPATKIPKLIQQLMQRPAWP
jgi:hypothetical protein